MTITTRFLCAVGFLGSLLAVGTSNASTVVDASKLPAFLTGDPSANLLHGRDVLKYPKLAAIVGIRNPNDVMAAKEFVSRIDKHLISQESLFASMDTNKDGRLTILEVAKKAWKMAVYFKYLDTNGDGVVTLDEFVSSRILFKIASSDDGQTKSTSVAGSLVAESMTTPQLSIRSKEEVFENAGGDTDDGAADYYSRENARLEKFFAVDHQKDDPVRVETVVVTGSNYQSSSGFYPVYGMWVDTQMSINVDSAALPDGALCRAACWAAGAAVCAAVASFCVVGTTITVGGLAIPCTAIVIASCAATGGAASVCNDVCSSQ